MNQLGFASPPLSRRSLVGGLGAGAAYATLRSAGALAQSAGDPLQHEPQPPARRLGICVVGVGLLTQGQILPAFARSRRTKLVALVSGREPVSGHDGGGLERTRALAADHGLAPDRVYDYGRFSAIANDPAIDAVYVVLPNFLHRHYTEAAFAAGKHVLCEKPMATSSADCRAMILAGRRANRTLMIAYRAQYEPHNLAMIDFARGARWGRTRFLSLDQGQNQPIDQTPWRLRKAEAGGGSLTDIGIYGLNAARYLTGEEPVEIDARISTSPSDPRFSEVEDRVAWRMLFPSGIMANCGCSYSYDHQTRYTVFKEQGWGEADPATLYRGNQVRFGQELAGGERRYEEPQIEEVDQFATELDAFAGYVADKQTPKTPGEEGYQDLRLIEAIYQSARERRPVTLPGRRFDV